MPQGTITEVSPKKVMQAVKRGRDRLANFRSARLHFLRQYTGAYYDQNRGEIGSEALNMIFNAVRVLLPTMVMNFPRTTVSTPYIQSRDYAELLGLALDQQDLKLDICNEYRAVLVDAIFTLGILKTGLCQSDDVLALDDMEGHVDNGTVYSKKVDFDNFVVDPSSKEHMFSDASFMGDRITVPRRVLLDSGLYKNDLVERLPRAGDEGSSQDRRAYKMSMKNIDNDQNADLEDDVEIYEIWVPNANAIVTVPGGEDIEFDDYLRVDDYYGVKEGPYTLLALTPPVSGNPLPVPMVGIWSDLHELSNRMAKKIIEQAERQKDIVAYKRSAADDVKELQQAGDGDSVAVDEVDAARVMSFGGQQNSNENHLASLQAWFNMMAGNPEQVGGQRVDAKSATAAQILQQNSSISLEDMKDMVYKFSAAEKRKRAWFLHTDPLMNIPLVKRQVQPPEFILGMNGQPVIAPPAMQEQQIILTPEARTGAFLDYTFAIEPESMGRIDSKVRLQQAFDFSQKILPAVAAAAQIFQMLGIPFNALAFMLRMAKETGIRWMDEVLYDPMFQQHMLMQQMMGPQMQDSKGQLGGPKPQGQPPSMMDQVLQNGQPGSVMGGQPSADEKFNQNAQAGANDAQMMLKAGMRHAFLQGAAPKPANANANAF
jgi:hypothetical protein